MDQDTAPAQSGKKAAKSSDLVFIVGRQRSGTTVLRQLLVGAGALDCDEIFHGNLARPHRFYAFLATRAADNPSLVHPQHHQSLFQEYIAGMRGVAAGRKLAMDVKYFGLNLIPAREDVDGKRPFVAQFMNRTGAHVIHIVRRNKLRVYVSEEMSKATGKWSAGKAEHLLAEKPRLTLDPDKVRKMIRKLVGLDERVAQQLEGLPGLASLVYEDMFDAEGNFSKRTMRVARTCMDGAPIDRTPSNLRMNPEPLSDLLANYDEVAAALADTKHGWMLEGG